MRGELAMEESLAEGSMRPPLTRSPIRNENIYINAVISSAMFKARTLVKSMTLKAELEQLQAAFPNYTIDNADLHEEYLRQANIPSNRLDYRRGVAMAIAILSGDSIAGFEGDMLVPQCILDLDLLFEELCAESVRRLLNPERFEVLYNNPRSHPSIPPSAGFFKPDITVRDRVSNQFVILDAKNKYSLRSEAEFNISNADLFQISYYGLALNAKAVILLYPSAVPKFRFPIQGSEGAEKYQSKVRAAMDSEKFRKYTFSLGLNTLPLMTYEIQLSGGIRETWESSAGLASLLVELLVGGS